MLCTILVEATIHSPQMPKGALLHAHLDATVDPEKLLKLALKHSTMHICVPEILTAQNIWSVRPTFRALPQSKDGPGVTDQNYTPNAFVTIQKARATFDSSLGGPEGFDKWVYSILTISPAEAYDTHNTITKVLILAIIVGISTYLHNRFGRNSRALLLYPVYASLPSPFIRVDMGITGDDSLHSRFYRIYQGVFQVFYRGQDILRRTKIEFYGKVGANCRQLQEMIICQSDTWLAQMASKMFLIGNGCGSLNAS